MEEAAPAEAAGDGGGFTGLMAVSRALEVLRAKWGDRYATGHDDEHGYWATRHGRVGHIITANDPDELDRLVADDLEPVTR